ncbi:MAG TPA: choice-of-anchor D domain-containing protein [Myxococcales bacterium]
MQKATLALGCLLFACSTGPDQLVMTPGQLDFGNVAVGTEATATITLQNRDFFPTVVSQLSELGDPAFEVVGLPLTLKPGEAGQVTVRYRPTGMGIASHSLEMSSGSTLALRGNAVMGMAQISTLALDFGTVTVGSTAVLPLTLTNADAQATTAVTVAAPAVSAFRSARTGVLSLAPQQSMALSLTFAPQATGDFSTTVAVAPCPSCEPVQVALHGIASGSLP